MFRSPSSKSTAGSPQQNPFKRTFRTSLTGSLSAKSAASDLSIEGEVPVGLLRVQVVSCRDLPAADLNGKSDPYVVITFGNQRVKTPVVKKNLNPKFPAKEATFDLPVFASVLGTRGALLDFVVWDKDIVGKDYLAECSLSPSQWYKRRNSPNDAPVYAFDDAGNNPLSYPLINSKPRKSRSASATTQPTIQVKIGLVPLDSETQNLQIVYEDIIAKASQATDGLLSFPPSQAIGALRPGANRHLSLMGPQASSGAAKTSKKSFTINWDGSYIDYDFASKTSIMGIILLEVQSAKELPRIKNLTRTSFDMDPYVVIKYNDELYRTRVIRHDPNPSFNDRFILFVRRSGRLSHATGAVPGVESSTVILSIQDWEQLSKNKHVGTAVLNLQPLIDATPKPDPETGLYSPEAMRLHNFSEVNLEVGVAQSDKWDVKATPTISIKAKYDPNAAMRQRYWRSNLKDFDKDHTGQLSHAELLNALEETGLPVSTEHVDGFFTELNKNPENDELTIEEAMICLEKEYGAVAQMKAEEEAAVAAVLAEEPDADTSVIVDHLATTSGAPPAVGPATDAVTPDVTPPASPTRMPRPARSSMFGHSRESIYDLEQQLRKIFQDHPQAYYLSEEDRENGDAVVPASALLSVLESFSEMHDMELLEPEDQKTLQSLVQGMDGEHIGPDFLITFLAKATGTASEVALNPTEASADPAITPSAPSPKSPEGVFSDQADDEDDLRGRSQDSAPHHSRDSSRDSVVTSYKVPPETPKSASVFDVRPRNTPLEAMAPPSSWTPRPAPASRRRKSSTGSLGSRAQSEGEEASPRVTSHGRPRAPSNPVTPARLPPFTFPPRPQDSGHSSPDESPVPRSGSEPISLPGGFRSLRLSNKGSISSPTLPISNGHDQQSPSPERMATTGSGPSLESSGYGSFSQDDDELGSSFHDRFSSEPTSMFSSSTTASGERYEDLERVHEETVKKLKELQRTLDQKMADHESEIEEMLVRKEELEAELASSKRDEKELRLKEVNSTKQLSALESEVSRLQKELDNARASYQNLQKMYQEQCNEAEKYRDSLRRKDMDLKDSERYVSVISADVEKWQAQSEASQQLVDSLKKELDAARGTLESLERQKHENLSLKETIDRLRFEIDELRNSRAEGTGSTGVSRAGTLAPSLAAEMQQTLLQHAGPSGEESGGSTGEGEYVETIITRRMLPKKPRTSNEGGTLPVQEIFGDYTDASTQHDISEFTTEASAQTFESGASSSPSSSEAGPSKTHLTPVDAPPSYSRLVEDEARKLGLEEVAKWHSGRQSTDPLPQGISINAVEEWRRLKSELGFSCLAIDEVVQKSEVIGPRQGSDTAPESATLSADKPSGPGGLEPLTKWTIAGLVGAFCLFSFVSGYGLASLFRNRGPRFDRRLWDVVNDYAKAGTFPDALHRPPLMPWSTIKNIQEHFRPNWEPV